MSKFTTADGRVTVESKIFTEWTHGDLAVPAEKLIISLNGYYDTEVTSIPALRSALSGHGYHLSDLHELGATP